MPVNEVKAAEGVPSTALGQAGGAGKRAYVRRMFSEIAPRYDLLNHLLSLGMDRGWRRRALAALGWPRRPRGLYLDLCAGTLDIGAALARERGFEGTVVGADFAEPMLRAGRGKAPPEVIHPVVADVVELPFRDAAAAGAIVGFGVRNLADLPAGLEEVHRVLEPGGRFVILELSTPERAPVRAAYQAYFHHVLPILGALVSGHDTAYRYLPESVKTFPSRAGLSAMLERAGFARVASESLTLGIAAIHVGTKT